MTPAPRASAGQTVGLSEHWIGTTEPGMVWGLTRATSSADALSRCLSVPVELLERLAATGKPVNVGTLACRSYFSTVLGGPNGERVDVAVVVVDGYVDRERGLLSGPVGFVAVPNTSAGYTAYKTLMRLRPSGRSLGLPVVLPSPEEQHTQLRLLLETTDTVSTLEVPA